ncbi:MAG: helix-turn-helix transcriptional regulator [Thermomicrobiales bacterium]|nr:helix-turn-helix transcriptional regulator [Thermomicrobiales bacterium]
MSNKHLGESFDDFLIAEGAYEEVKTQALTDVLNWMMEEMERQEMSKTQLASQMGTSRSQVDRLINRDVDDVKLSTVVKAAHAFGKTLRSR